MCWDMSLITTREYLSIFNFPKDKDNLKKSGLFALPRKDWTPFQFSAVSSVHFQERDISKNDIYTLPNELIQKHFYNFQN